MIQNKRGVYVRYRLSCESVFCFVCAGNSGIGDQGKALILGAAASLPSVAARIRSFPDFLTLRIYRKDTALPYLNQAGKTKSLILTQTRRFSCQKTAKVAQTDAESVQNSRICDVACPSAGIREARRLSEAVEGAS